LLQQWSTLFLEEAWVVLLFWTPDTLARNSRVEGFVPTSDDSIHFGGIDLLEG